MNDGDSTGEVKWDDPELKAAVDWLVNTLTGRDEQTRRGVAARVAHEIHPEVRARVVGLLADRLGSERPKEPGRAAKALLGVGSAALPPLLPRLLRTADPAARDRLVAVVAGIGGTLPLPERVRLLLKLDIALGVAGDMDAAHAVARVMVRLRNDGPAAAEADPAMVELVIAIGARRLTGGWRKVVGLVDAEHDPDLDGVPHEPLPEGEAAPPGPGCRPRAGPTVLDDG